MSLRYKILFIAEVLHDYYESKVCKDFEIIPSADTLTVLKGQGMLYKVVGNKLIVLVKVDEDDKPMIPFDEAKKLSFYMKIDNPHLYNFTNINYQPSQPKRYYLSNINQTKIGSTLYLNSKIHDYNSANTYPVGAFAANGSDDVFEAIKLSDNGNQHDVSDATYWASKNNNQYVNENDLLEFAPSLYNFPLPADTNFNIRIFSLNTTTGIYDEQIRDTEVQTFSSPQTQVQIKLEALPAGKYRIQVNATSREVYVDNSIKSNNVFGVIEIFNYLDSANDFSLFNPDETSKETTYTIQFASRSVIWKYKARTNNVTAISNGGDAFVLISPKEYISAKPIPFTEKPNAAISLTSTVLGNVINVANPANDRLNTLVKDGDTYLSAEKFLNY